MGIVIYGKFPRQYSLKQARKFLGSGFFRKALMEMSLEDVERMANASEASLTDAWLAYGAIYRYRKLREQPNKPCEVVKIAA